MTDEQTLAWHYWNSLRTAALADLPRACCRYGVQMSLAEQVAKLTLLEMEELALEVDLLILKPTVNTKQLATILSASRFTSRHPRAMRIVARMAAGEGQTSTCNQDQPLQLIGDRNHA